MTDPKPPATSWDRYDGQASKLGVQGWPNVPRSAVAPALRAAAKDAQLKVLAEVLRVERDRPSLYLALIDVQTRVKNGGPL